MRKLFILGLTLLFIPLSICVAQEKYAQEKKQLSPFVPWKNKSDCDKNFDIRLIEEAMDRQALMEGSEYLKGYYMCRAISSQDRQKCNNLDSYWSKQCWDEFRNITFFIKLVSNPSITPNLLIECNSILGSDEAKCRNYIQAFVNKDISFCEGDKTLCIPMVNLDETSMQDSRMKTYILMLKAYKYSSINWCERIQDSAGYTGYASKEICKFLVTRKKGICEQCPGLENFKASYCSEFDKK